MNIKWTGSLGFAVVAALSGACGGGGGGGGGVVLRPATVLAGTGLFWVNQQRVPTSSHLRVVRFANAVQGLLAGEATTFLRADDGGSVWTQQEHTPRDRGGDVAGLDFDGTRVRAVGRDASGGKNWDSQDTLTWTTANAAGSGADFVAVDVERGTVAPNYAVSFRLRTNGDVQVTDAPENPVPITVTTPSGIGGPATCIEVVGAGLATWYVGGSNAAATGGEIRRTNNAASSWGTETLPGGSGIIRDLFFSDEDEGVACGDGSTVIRRTTAGGSVWTDVSGDLPGGLVLRGIFFPNSQVGWVVGDAGVIYKTTNGGTNWVLQAAGTVEDLYDVWFLNTGTGYAVGDNGTVLRCSNGNTWTLITDGDLVTFNAVDFTPDGVRGIAVGNDLGGRPSVYRTLDGGLHWALFNAGLPAGTADYYGASIPRAGSGGVAYICGSGGTIYRNTAIGGNGTWEAMNSFVATTLRAILFPDGNENGVCVGDGNTIVYTDTGTTSLDWTTVLVANKPAAAPDYKALSFARDGTGIRLYAAGTAGIVARATSFPAPAVWNQTGIPVVAGGATTIQALSSVIDPATGPDVLFAAGSNASLYRLAVGGAWATAPPASAGAAANGLAFTDLNNGWWVSDAIYTTTNGGTTWTLSPDHTKSTLRAVWVDAAGLVSYAAGDNGTILKSTSGGKP